MTCRLHRTATVAMGLSLQLALAGHASAVTWAQTAIRPVPVPAHTVLDTVAADQPVHLVMGLALRQPALLANRIQARGLRLDRADYQRDHAPAAHTVARLVQHLKSAGFTQVRVTPSQRLVEAIGTAGDAERAFQITLAQYKGSQGQQRVARQAPRLPADLAGQVTGIMGLQTVRLHLPTAAKERGEQQAAQRQTAEVPRYPEEFAKAYQADRLPPATQAAVGHIGFGYMDWAIEDLNTYAAYAGYPAPTIRVVRVGEPSDDKSGTFGMSADSQLALAAAGGQLSETIFYAGWDISDASLAMAIDAAVEENRAQTLNFDLLGDELIQDSGWASTVDQLLMVAAAQGQSMMVVGGNNGSKNCFAWAGHQELGYPAVSPWAVAVAGSKLVTNDKGKRANEKAWRCSVGGYSQTQPAPQWQIDSGLFGGSSARAIPDVALSTNAMVWYGDWVQADSAGTSMAIFSGLWARLQNAHGNSLGFASPLLYQAGVQSPEVFYDITQGHNAYYNAQPGWDFVSGFGSPNLQTLSKVLR